MAIVKKYNKLLDLDDIDVLVDENDKSKHIIVTDMPESMPQGKSSFLIETSPFMRPGVELQMDFIDSEGASIYTEAVFEYLEGTARRVSVEIYSDTAPGIATLIIVGELEGVPEDNTIFSESDPIPKEYEGVYNVRLIKQVIINPTAVNTQPIKFFTQPQIRVFETQLGTMVRSEITGSISSPLFSVEGTPTDLDMLYKPHGMIEGEAPQGTLSETTTTAPSRRKNIKSFTETRKLKFRKGLRKNSSGKRSGFTAKRSSPAKFPYQLKIGEGETFRFNTKHIGGEVHLHDASVGNLFADTTYYPTEALTTSGLLDTPTFDVLKVPGITNITPSNYTASIVDLVNSETALVELPFTNKNVNGENIILPVFGRGEIFFESMPTGSYAPANLVSYADIRLSNMRTFSGDVFKVKVYVKSEGGFDDFKLLAEVPMEGRELLIDDASVGQGERTGYVIKQEEIATYWDVYGGENGLYQMPAAAAALSASYDNDTLLDSFQLSGSITAKNDNIRFQLKDDYFFQLTPGLDYTLSANIIGSHKGPGALLMLYVSGSSMYQKTQLYNNVFTGEDIQEPIEYGKRLGVLEVGAKDGNETRKDFGLLTHNFTPDISGSGVVQFRSVSGQWNISDISIMPSDDTGFSPSFFQFTQELPSALSHKRPDKFEFLVEFYDINNNISDTIVYASDVSFQGTNMTITGNDNVLESSLFIGGDTVGGGMHLGGVTSTLPETGGPGADGSGFMRSVGYQGHISASAQSGSYGFMIWSGSVLPASGDDYKGVGLELVGVSGSFKFRTSPSVFDVRADAFFVGNPDLQFISGSGSDIEISSSDFHLTPEGNVTASAILLGDKGGGNYLQFVGDTLTVAGDLSVNNLFLPATIAGATSNILNASSSLDERGFAKFVSASIGGWGVTTGSIESVGGSLVLDPAGRQFRVSDGSNDRVHIGQVATGEYGMKVFDGTGTADSDILVELGQGGNNIAGWTINSDTLQGGNMIIDKSGTIKSANYQRNVAGSGFILTAAEGGYLEVENAKIRGTMATTTFEKESVNAVGGQLYVANSTTLTSSAAHVDGNYPATETTMSVANVTGFAAGEILVIKKITSTGFNTEYVKVLSSSASSQGDDTDLTGDLHVIRGYSGSQPSGQDSSSLGDTAGSAAFYSGSQVVVSTGKIGTGFVRINANPNDSSTPYIDIVERTGSAIYDTELKVRLGDLSGVAGTRNVPSGFTGFGLMSEVAFLSGSNIKLEAPTFLLGDLNSNFVSGSNGNMEISSSNFHLQPDGNVTMTGAITATSGRIGGVSGWTIATNKLNSGTNLTLDSGTNDIQVAGNDGLGIYFGPKGELDDATGGTGSFWVTDDDFDRQIFRVGSATSYVKYDSGATSALDIKVQSAVISGSSINIETPTFLLGDLNSNFVSGSSGNIEISSSNFHVDSKNTRFFVGVTTGSRIEFDGSDIIMSSSAFSLGSEATAFVSGSNGNIEISSSNFHLSNDGSIIANRMTLSSYAQADYFNFKNVTVQCDDPTEVGKYFVKYLKSTVPYYALIINGSRGGDSGAFIRLNDGNDLAYPIGMIIVPGFESGHQIYIEAGDDGDYAYFAQDKTISSADLETAAVNASLNKNLLSLDFSADGGGGTSREFDIGKYQLGSDTDDTIGGSSNNVAGDSFYSYDVTLADPNIVTGHDGGTYTDLGRIGTGDRYHFVKSLFDWRVMGVSAYSFAPSFYRGIAVAGGSGGITIGDSALQNSTYKLNVSNGAAYVRDHIVTGGGIHIGGTSDPGDDNLIVDGLSTLTDTVLIGRTTVAATTLDPKLEIDGGISFDGFLSRAGMGGSDNGANWMNFYWDGSYLDGWVDTTEVWPNETSDYRIKENVATMTGSFDNGILKKVNELRPINYTQKSCSIWTQSDDLKVSFLAHELADVFPNIVKGEYNATGSNGEPIMQSYNNTHLTTYLVKAVQELTQAHNHLIAAITGSTDLNQLKASVTASLIG